MKKKYSTFLNFALAACVATTLAACSDGDTTGSTGAKYSNPKIDIGGVVQDTNGNPLADVSVSCQGTTVKTNALGQYIAKNLKVTNVAGADNDTAHNPVSCVIGAPTGYLGATVTVYPEAQIDDTPSTGGLLDVIDSVTNPRTTFIDGMYAEAGTAVLPALDSSICGRLENCTTEEGYGSVEIRLDLHDVGNDEVHQEQEQDSVDTSYATATYAATTDANGNFCISGVPNDSYLYLYVPDWTDESVTEVVTYDEGINNYGDICVNPIVTGDGQRPCLVGATDYVHGWDPNSEGGFGQSWSSSQSLGGGFILWAVLNDDVDGTGDGFSLMFNETMDPDAVDENSVVLWNEGPDTLNPIDDEYITDFTATVSGNALTIVTTDPLGPDDHIKIYMLLDDFQDTAGNYLATEDMIEDGGVCDNTPNNLWGLPWVNDFISNNNTLYAVAGVKIFSPDSTDAGEVTDLDQVCLADGGPDGFLALNAAYPEVFTDMNTGRAGFQNLNSDDDFWEQRLEAVAQGGGNNATVENDYALITYMTPADGTNTVDTGSTNFCGPTSNTGLSQSCVIYPASVGQRVTVTSYDDFSNPSNVVYIDLVDCAAPTTVLNYAYNTCGHVGYNPGAAGLVDAVLGGYDTDYAGHICTVGEIVGDPAYGDGGENSEEAEGSILGLPTLNITCRLLKDSDDAPAVSEPIDFFGLYGQIDTWPMLDVPNLNNELYDATAFAGWQPVEDTIGVAFSENIAMTAGGAISWAGDAAITSWTVGNNISQQDDGEPTDANAAGNAADLAQITVDDVITLANDDHGEVMDFSDAIQDLAGNDADNARVVVNDLLPPFVVSAYWDGDLVIAFNEPVNVCLDVADGCTPTTVTLMDPTYGGSGVYTADSVLTTQGALLSVDGMTLTIPSATLGADLNFDRGVHFPGIATTGALVYDEPAYDTIVASPLSEYSHGRLNFDNIEDMNGNSWEEWDGDTPGTEAVPIDFVGIRGQALCNTPEFAAVDALGPFIITSIPLTQEPGDPINRFNVVYTFSLPIDYAFSFNTSIAGTTDCSGVLNTPVCANAWLAEAGNLAAVSTLSYAGATATTGSTYNDLTRTLTLVFDGSGNWVTGDSIAFSTSWRWISAFGGNSRTLNDHVIE